MLCVCLCMCMHIYILIFREELGYTLAPGDTSASVAYQQIRKHLQALIC